MKMNNFLYYYSVYDANPANKSAETKKMFFRF